MGGLRVYVIRSFLDKGILHLICTSMPVFSVEQVFQPLDPVSSLFQAV